MINIFVKDFEDNQTTSVLIDVREEDEFIKFHIPNSINIPLSRFDITKLDKNKKIYVYCQTGKRSEIACNFLKNNGYTCINIGGIKDYKH